MKLIDKTKCKSFIFSFGGIYMYSLICVLILYLVIYPQSIGKTLQVNTGTL